MSLIPVRCKVVGPAPGCQTETWPEYLSCRPMVGDFIRGVDGGELMVSKVSHAFDHIGSVLPSEPPYKYWLELELTLPPSWMVSKGRIRPEDF